MGAHHRRDNPETATARPTFDEVPRGYDQRQVDDYLNTLWRYASSVTSRAAAAEAALERERRRRDGENHLPNSYAAQAGGRIGLMLAIAQQEADEILAGARQIAERALEEAIEDAAANHPIVREAREQADKLLLDAVEEGRERAQARHSDIELEIGAASAALEDLRHQQGEIIGALLRLRGLINAEEVDMAVADLARSGTGVDGPASMPRTAAAAAGSAPRRGGPDLDGRAEAASAPRPPRSRPPDPYYDDDDIIDAEVVEE